MRQPVAYRASGALDIAARFNVSRRDVVWHGTAEGRLSEAMMRDAGAAAEKAVAAVFEGFPVKPLKRSAAGTTH